jgi:hypothetical protein
MDNIYLYILLTYFLLSSTHWFSSSEIQPSLMMPENTVPEELRGYRLSQQCTEVFHLRCATASLGN